MSDLPKKVRKPLVVVGPSGVGKGTLIKLLRKEFPNDFAVSVSHTTRPRRVNKGEKHGVHYYYISREEFERKIKDGDFLEHAVVFKNLYGTSFKSVQDVADSGKICLLEIDTQGAEQIYRHKDIDPFIVFIHPPSYEELESRLKGRKSDSDEQIKVRLNNAKNEIQWSKENEKIVNVQFVHGLKDDKRDVETQIQSSYKKFREMICKAFELKSS